MVRKLLSSALFQFEQINHYFELFNLFRATGPFRYLLKTFENQRYKKRPVVLKGGIKRDQWHEMG